MRRVALLSVLVASFSVTSYAKPPQPVAVAPVDFFKARKAGDLDAKFIAANEKRGHLLLKNNGKQPLKIRMPDAFAGVPVLGQFLPNLPNPNTPPGQGVGFPGPGGPVVPFNPAVGPARPGWFNVAPERLVELKPGQKRTIRIESVCLDHGKPTPNSRMKYDVVPLGDYKPGKELAELMIVFGEGKYSQPAVQAMAWYYANEKTMEELRTMRHPKTRKLMFTRAQIAEAVRLKSVVEHRAERREESSSAAPATLQTSASQK